MTNQHTPGPVGVESNGNHWATVGRATPENSAILRGIERRKAERKELIDALERTRSLLVVAEGQFKGEFQQRVRAGIAQASAAIANATGSAA